MSNKHLRHLILFGLSLCVATPTAQAQVVLYENTKQGGKALTVSSWIPQLSKHNLRKNRFLSDEDWNDKASSIKIDEGSAAFLWNDKNYKGTPVVLSPGQWDLSATGMSDEVSSIKIGVTKKDGSATFGNGDYLPVGGCLIGFPEASTAKARQFAPQFDFDSDGCYAAAAVSYDNVKNPGYEVSTGMTKWGRSAKGLMNANTYVRRFVAQKDGDRYEFIMYALYFQKDVWSDLAAKITDKGSHKHDWEYVGVWLKNGKQEYAHCSAHKDSGEKKKIGSKVKAVYHKDNVRTHSIRFANDNEQPENELKKWFTPKILEWDFIPEETREVLLSDWGHANFPLRYSEGEIKKYAPEGWPEAKDWNDAPKEKKWNE